MTSPGAQITLRSIALMFPVALLSGILFPSIAANVQASVGDRMNSTGITTLFNTTGAAVGPLLASFVLLPGIGYQWSLILCAAGYALLSILVTDSAGWSFRRPLGLVIAGFWVALILILVIFPYHRDDVHFAHARHFLGHLVKKIEGPSDTYQLLRHDLFGEPYYYQLLTSAFSMSGHKPAESALHENVRISSVGFPSGIRRCAAYLLWVRGHGGCVSSWATR